MLAGEAIRLVAFAVREGDVVKIPEQARITMQPRHLMLNAEFFRRFDYQAAFEADSLVQPLKQAEDDVFPQLVHGCAIRHAEVVRLDSRAVLTHP